MTRACAIFSVVVMALFAWAPLARAQTSEELVKATFVYRFASFVTWPPDAFADPEAPISLCVIGADPFAAMLTRTVNGQRVGGREFTVRRLVSATATSHCHVIYVVGDRVDDTLRVVRGRGVLTITDGSVGGGDERGMIHFVIVDDRVRFHIDEARASESHMAVDPRLLSLALSVRRRAGS